MQSSVSFYFLLITVSIFSCSAPEAELSSEQLVQKSIQKHDPEGHWNQLTMKVHIQEPRVGNVARYSKVYLDNKTGAFILQRNRGASIATYQIDTAEVATILLDGLSTFPDSLIDKYRLDPARNESYRRFYQVLYGLPMSLNNLVEQFGAPEQTIYNRTDCFKIPATLREALFSKNWIIYIGKEDYTLQGMEIIFPDDPARGERLLFSGNVTIQGVHVPRIRHWYEYHDNTYSGSDIMVQELD